MHRRKIKILHVVGGMRQGGIETWLMNVLRHIDCGQFQCDFLVHTEEPCAYDEEIRRRGSKIIPCLDPHNPWRYAQNFKKLMKEFGPYDVVHSHVHLFSGVVLRLASAAGVPIRVAHSHNDTSELQKQSNFLRRGYYALMRAWIKRYATSGLGASNNAAAALFGQNWCEDIRWKRLYYAIDLSPFAEDVNSAAVRREMGFSESAFIIGHVGRFVEQKNHAFLVEIASELVKRERSAKFLLVGEGSLRTSVERRVSELGLSNNFCFAGTSSQVARLMRGAMNVFLLPSHFEGLGLVLVEAQASGIPCVLSDVVPQEADIVPSLMCRMPLSGSAAEWADAILNLHGRARESDRIKALATVAQSQYNILTNIRTLEGVYVG